MTKKEHTMSEFDLKIAVGGLLKDAESSQKQRAALFDKIDEQTKQAALQNAATHKMITDLAGLVTNNITAGELRLEAAEKAIGVNASAIKDVSGRFGKFRTKVMVGTASLTGGGGVIGYLAGAFDAMSKKVGGP